MEKKRLRDSVVISALLAMILSLLTVILILLAGYVLLSIFRRAGMSSDQFGVDSYPNVMMSPYQNVYYDRGLGSIFKIGKVPAIILSLVMIVVFVSFFVGYFEMLTAKFFNYIEEIRDGAERVVKGDISDRIPHKFNNELTDISDDINEIAGRKNVNDKKEKESDKYKDELITNIAHDLRTPLTSVIGYLDLVRGGTNDAETEKKYIKIAYEKASRMKVLTDELFEYAKHETDVIKLNKTDFDIVKLIEQLMEEFYPEFKRVGFDTELKTDSESIIVNADGDEIARMFANLISNAIKYGVDGKNLEVHIKHSSKYVTVDIVNFGGLIPKEKIGLIFEKFYRVDESRNVVEGSGLGLAIAKNIVEKHEGMISAKSSYGGTAFEVSLPLGKTQEE